MACETRLFPCAHIALYNLNVFEQKLNFKKLMRKRRSSIEIRNTLIYPHLRRHLKYPYIDLLQEYRSLPFVLEAKKREEAFFSEEEGISTWIFDEYTPTSNIR